MDGWIVGNDELGIELLGKEDEGIDVTGISLLGIQVG